MPAEVSRLEIRRSSRVASRALSVQPATLTVNPRVLVEAPPAGRCFPRYVYEEILPVIEEGVGQTARDDGDLRGSVPLTGRKRSALNTEPGTPR